MKTKISYKNQINNNTEKEMNTFFLEEIYFRANKTKSYVRKHVIQFLFGSLALIFFICLQTTFIENVLPLILLHVLRVASIALTIFFSLRIVISLFGHDLSNLDLLNFDNEIQKHLTIKNPTNTQTIQNFIILSEIIRISKYSYIFDNHISMGFLKSLLDHKHKRDSDINKSKIHSMYWDTLNELFIEIGNKNPNTTEDNLTSRKNEIVKNFIINGQK